jgi:hypothetical protein
LSLLFLLLHLVALPQADPWALPQLLPLLSLEAEDELQSRAFTLARELLLLRQK